jgi:hypothetical protein
MIKQLEWSDCAYIGERPWYGATGIGGAYDVRVAATGVKIRYPGTSFQPFDGDVEAAKAEAQRHFEEKVKSLLDIPVDHDGTPFKLLPEDLYTHLHDFEKAVEIAVSVSNIDSNEESYWIKQRETIARIKEQLK